MSSNPLTDLHKGPFPSDFPDSAICTPVLFLVLHVQLVSLDFALSDQLCFTEDTIYDTSHYVIMYLILIESSNVSNFNLCICFVTK